MHRKLTRLLAQWGCCAMSNTRNYEYSATCVINNHIKAKGYFSLAEARSMYHARFLVGLYQMCKAMVASGKLVYDAQSKQYKKP